MESILTSIKKLLGITEEYEHFDQDLIIHINSVFATLTQIGVGPADGFSISDKSSEWTDFIGDVKTIENVKTYIYIKIKLVFDPPTSSSVIEVYKEEAKQLEWRLNTACDTE